MKRSEGPESLPTDPSFVEALDEALRLEDEGCFDAEAFQRRFPKHASAVLRKLSMMQALLDPSPSPLAPSGRLGDSQPTRRRMGDFELVEEIGRGGMGVVYRAHQISLDRDVAVKVLPPAFGANTHLRSRFEREAAAAARLSHPAIVKVHAFGEEDATLYIAMERVDGPSLAAVLARLKERRSDGGPEIEQLHEALGVAAEKRSSMARGFRGYLEAVVGICVVIADALQSAHDHGLVHRDVKPANILLDRELRPNLTDFGLVGGEGTERITLSGQVLGTAGFMAPEMVRGRETDHRVDVFSLGVVLYEALLLELPFAGETTEQIVHAVAYHDPPAPDRKDRRIPHDLSTVVLRALEKEPDRRYARAADLHDDLTRFLHGEPVLASRVGPLGRVVRRARRRPLAAAATLGLAVTTIILAILFVSHLVERAERGRRAVTLLEEAERHEKGDRFEAALVACRQALELDPDSATARTRAEALSRAVRTRRLAELRHLALAELMAAQRDPELAEQAGRRVASLVLEGGDTREVLTLKAIAAYTVRDFAAAFGHLERVKRFGDSLASELLGAWIHAAEGRKAEAARGFERARKLRPVTLEDFVLAAERAVLNRDETEAFALLREARSRWPRSPHVPFKLGLLLKDRENNDQAIEAFTTAIELAPGHALALMNRGYLFLGKGKVKEGHADFVAALEAHPRDPYAIGGLARSLRAQGKGKEATALIAKALTERPRNAVLLSLRGFDHLGGNRTADAEQDFRAAIAAWPDHPYAYGGLTGALLRQKRRKEALETMAAGLARPDMQPFARRYLLNQRAILRWRQRDLAEADLREGLEVCRSPNLVGNLALLLIHTGRMAEAVPLLSEQMAAGHRAAVARARRGWCRWNLLDVEGGIADTDAAIVALEEKGRLRRFGWILENRAHMAAAAGDSPAAIRLARRASALDARHRATLVRYLLLSGALDETKRLIESGVSVREPFGSLARIWIDAREGRVEAACERLHDLDVDGGTVLWPTPAPWVAIRWAGDPARPAPVREVGRRLLEGRPDLEALRGLSLPAGNARIAAERDWFVGHLLLAEGRAKDALPHLERAAEALNGSCARVEQGVALALTGKPGRAMEVWNRTRPGWSRFGTLWLAVRHGLRSGDPDLDRWVRTPPRQ